MPENEIPKDQSGAVPKELLELARSENTALEVGLICFDNKISEEKKIKEIAYQIGRVLLGDLPPKDLPDVLKDKIEISPFVVRKITREINESIFYPVKEKLAVLYEEGVIPDKEVPVKPLSEIEEVEEKPETPTQVDVYKEPIE